MHSPAQSHQPFGGANVSLKIFIFSAIIRNTGEPWRPFQDEMPLPLPQKYKVIHDFVFASNTCLFLLLPSSHFSVFFG